MVEFNSVCNQFASILRGKSKVDKGVCTVSFHRNFTATVQGKRSKSVLSTDVSFETLDEKGVSLNIVELAILQEEIPAFMQAVVRQGLIVSALHNHWILTSPLIMYIHVQSVESPLDFAKKIAYAFTKLSSYPISQ